MPPDSSSATSHIQRRAALATLWVTGGMMVGRLIGIVRELLIADTFGVSRNADVAVLLVAGPDILVTVTGSGAASLVLIPILLEQESGDRWPIVTRLTRRLGVISLLLGVTVGLVVAVVAADWATVDGLSASRFRLAVGIAVVAVPFSTVVALTAAFLRAEDRFAVVSFATVTFSVPVVASIVVFRSVVGVAIGLAVGAVLRYGSQVVVGLRHRGVPSGRVVAWSLRQDHVGTSVGISVLQAAQAFTPILIVTFIGVPGDVAILNYGWRILLIPVGLLTSVFSVATYPSVVRLLTARESSLDGQAQRRAVQRILLPPIQVSASVAAWLVVNASPVARALYGSTDLTDMSLDRVADEIRLGAVALPFIIIGSASTTVLFGLQKAREALVPYVVATLALALVGSVGAVVNGPVGVMVGVLVYGVLLTVVGVGMLWRAAGLFVVGRVAVAALIAAGLAGLALAAAIRELTGASLLAVVVGGLLYTAVLAGIVIAGVLRRRTRSQAEPSD